jgi:mono/diheme cytochrome c family protein
MSGARGLALLLLAGAVTACGGSRGPSTEPSGARVFAGECAVCHSLIGNESLHRQGGDLLGYRISRQQLVQFTREMPVRHRLTPAELDAVVGYVFALQQRAGAR